MHDLDAFVDLLSAAMWRVCSRGFEYSKGFLFNVLAFAFNQLMPDALGSVWSIIDTEANNYCEKFTRKGLSHCPAAVALAACCGFGGMKRWISHLI